MSVYVNVTSRLTCLKLVVSEEVLPENKLYGATAELKEFIFKTQVA